MSFPHQARCIFFSSNQSLSIERFKILPENYLSRRKVHQDGQLVNWVKFLLQEEAGPLDVLDASLGAPAAAESEAPAVEPDAPGVNAEGPAAEAEEAPEDVEEILHVAAEKRGWQLTPEGDAAILQGQPTQTGPCAPFRAG